MVKFSFWSLYPALNSRQILEENLVGSRAGIEIFEKERSHAPAGNLPGHSPFSVLTTVQHLLEYFSI